MTSTLIEAVPCMLVEMNRCGMSHIASHQHATLYMFDGQLIMLVNILPHGQVALALLAGYRYLMVILSYPCYRSVGRGGRQPPMIAKVPTAVFALARAPCGRERGHRGASSSRAGHDSMATAK